MNKLYRFLDRVSGSVSSIAAVTGASLLALMVLMITVDVIGRHFGHPIFISNEMAGYLLVAVTFIGLTWTQKKGKHIRISVLTRRFPQKNREYLSLTIWIVSMIFIAWLAWCTTIPVIKSHAMGIRSLTPLRTPMWIPYMFVPIGLGILVIQLLTQIIRRENLEPPEES